MEKRNNKTAIIKGSNVVFFEDLPDIYMYYRCGIAFKIIRKIVRKFKIGFLEFLFYGNWKRNLRNYDLVILFDSECHERVIEYIRKKYPKIKIVLWYWNPINKNNSKLLNIKDIDSVWTYDRFDAEKYHLKYNPQFYHKILVDAHYVVDADLFFLGKNKGRKTMLDRLKKVADEKKIDCNFCIINKKSENIKYTDYVNRMLKSKCIVDLVCDPPCGLTLRPLEALFFKKKLITNNEDIVNYDFYNGNNIFIIGKDDIERITDFINSPYEEIDDEIVNFYKYDSWLKRIESEEDVAWV